jgi:hypothetical protein
MESLEFVFKQTKKCLILYSGNEKIVIRELDFYRDLGWYGYCGF